MPEPQFDAPVFIQETQERAVDIVDAPFFYNNAGQPTYVRELPAGLIPLVAAATNPAVAIGNTYVVPEVIGVKQTPPYGVETQLGFMGQEVEYTPMWATRDVAAASRTCSRISAADRLRVRPPWPVAQNGQAIPQPACDEMHTVVRSG